MKLSIGMIGETLQDFEPLCRYRGFDGRLNLERAIFYDGDLKLRGDTVYLFTEEMLKGHAPLSLEAEPGAAIIYLGSPDEFSPSANASFLCISPKKLSAANLSNRVQLCFERYRKIDQSLHEVIRTSNDIVQLVRLATPLFQNEITVRDRLFRYVAHSYRQIRYQTLFGSRHADTNEITPADEVNSLKQDPLYTEQISTQKPWFYQYGDYQMWCYDIFVNHVFTYRVKLIDTNHPFRPWDCELFDYFCQVLVEHMHDESLPEQDYDMVQLFQSLLETERVSVNQETQAILKKLNWEPQDCYLLLCLTSGKNNGKLNPLPYYRIYLQREYHDTFAIQKSQNLVLIVNLTRGYQGSEYEFMRQFSGFLRDDNFRAGISFPYAPVTHTVYAFQQAFAALQKGLTYAPELWSYPFKKYRYHYLFGLIFEDLPNYACILPELHLLEQYDEENHTNFVETLKCYLKNDRNMLKTANALNMHRSTLAYQLKKIKKIMGCNFDDACEGALLRFILQGLDL